MRKRRLVVREGRLNRAYASSVRLSERVDPDTRKKKKLARAVDVGGTEPIDVAPLSVAGPRDAGGSCRAAEDADHAAKRLTGSMEREECSESSNSSSDERVASTEEVGAAVVFGRSEASVGEAIGAFGVTHLAIDGSSCGGTPSRVYKDVTDVPLGTPLLRDVLTSVWRPLLSSHRP